MPRCSCGSWPTKPASGRAGRRPAARTEWTSFEKLLCSGEELRERVFPRHSTSPGPSHFGRRGSCEIWTQRIKGGRLAAEGIVGRRLGPLGDAWRRGNRLHVSRGRLRHAIQGGGRGGP